MLLIDNNIGSRGLATERFRVLIRGFISGNSNQYKPIATKLYCARSNNYVGVNTVAYYYGHNIADTFDMAILRSYE